MDASPQYPPGVHRLGDGMVNFYLVEEPDGLVLIDAGLPKHWDALAARLAELGAAPGDVRALLLTHAHPDHLGLAARLHDEAGTAVWVHEADAATLAAKNPALAAAKPERALAGYLARRPAALALPVHLARRGGFRLSPVANPHTFAERQELTAVPGRPEVLPLPGHTPGSVAYVFADRGVAFTGDALVTFDGLTGKHGPRLVCRGFTHDSAAAYAALDVLERLDVPLALPGHGDPMADGLAAAVDHARHVGVV
ncbi:MAG TPA: MBL fold metallo-hydrolase [Actinocrinis sp.]|nr:MBL fold metallo-hydrolase [Actinocrinis sp.]